MSDMNSEKNRVVWIDIPVADLDRAVAFYKAVLGIEVFKEQFEDFQFAVLAHEDGNGGCLIPKPEAISDSEGIAVYMNVNGRIRAAVEQVTLHGGEILKPIHPIGPHGFCARIKDSEGNRLALHSTVDE